MTFTIIIFFLALIVAFGLIGRRIWQIRTGKFIVDPSYEPADWTELSVEIIRDRLLEWAKFSVHHIILLLLKVWVKSSYALKRFDRKVREMLMHLLHRNAHLPTQGDPSPFLKNISDHKNTMMKSGTVNEEVRVENTQEIK